MARKKKSHGTRLRRIIRKHGADEFSKTAGDLGELEAAIVHKERERKKGDTRSTATHAKLIKKHGYKKILEAQAKLDRLKKKRKKAADLKRGYTKE